ncbi:MAG: nickel-binding protein [Gemmatimonadota bacterium]
MARIVLERSFDPETGKAEFARQAEELQSCIETREVRPIRSVIASDFSRSYCEFEAPDADTLRAACRRAGVEFERVWKAEELDWTGVNPVEYLRTLVSEEPT